MNMTERNHQSSDGIAKNFLDKETGYDEGLTDKKKITARASQSGVFMPSAREQ